MTRNQLDAGDGGTRPDPADPPRTTPNPPPDPPSYREETVELARFDIYLTAGDERVCPICGPWSGYLLLQGHAPYPPLHPRCRCIRQYHHSIWATFRVPN